MFRRCLAPAVLALTGILADPTLGASSPIVPVAAPAPVKLAVFDFELEDTSAALSEIASDATELANATEVIRQLLTRCGSIPGGRHQAGQPHRIYIQICASRCPNRRSDFGWRQRASNGRQLFVEQGRFAPDQRSAARSTAVELEREVGLFPPASGRDTRASISCVQL